MKAFNKISALLLVLMMALLAVSCEYNKSAGDKVEVTYVYNNGQENKTETVTKIVYRRPSNPLRAGYLFVGWCTDSELTNFYDFKNEPERDLTLYAKWTPDYEYLSEKTVKEAIRFGVKVKTTLGNGLTTAKNHTGSGVIFKEDSTHYYALTNAHVTDSEPDMLLRSYEVYDAYGNVYRAEKLASDSSFDLAVLRFAKRASAKLAVAQIREKIPSGDEPIICIGAPGGQMNSYTFGTLYGYKKIDSDVSSETEKLEFDVLWLDCYAENGSSGGAVVTSDMRLIGISFAVAYTSNGDFAYTFAIPAEKINEFLSEYSSQIGLE